MNILISLLFQYECKNNSFKSDNIVHKSEQNTLFFIYEMRNQISNIFTTQEIYYNIKQHKTYIL